MDFAVLANYWEKNERKWKDRQILWSVQRAEKAVQMKTVVIRKVVALGSDPRA